MSEDWQEIIVRKSTIKHLRLNIVCHSCIGYMRVLLVVEQKQKTL